MKRTPWICGLLISMILLLSACASNSGAPAGLQETADSLAATVAARATEAASPAGTAQPSLTPPPAAASPASTQAAPAIPGTGQQNSGPGSSLDPALSTQAAFATQMALQGQPLDPAQATAFAAGGGAAGGVPGAAVDPSVATQIAFATQMAEQGKPIEPALLTQVAATQAAGGGFNPATATAQAAAFDPFRAELAQYGVDPAQGQPGWVHPSLTLETQGHEQYSYAADVAPLIVKDFVVSADITWNTRYGDSGCGFVLRSDGNQDSANQYVAVITRGGSGHMIFSVMANGQIVNARDIYARGLDDKFEWRNDTTNRLTIVGRGSLFTVYTNGVRLGEIDPRKPPVMPPLPDAPQPPNNNDADALAAYQKAKAEYDAQVERIKNEFQARLQLFNRSNVVFDQGGITMIAATQGGYTQCKYDNAWLWIIQ